MFFVFIKYIIHLCKHKYFFFFFSQMPYYFTKAIREKYNINQNNFSKNHGINNDFNVIIHNIPIIYSLYYVP